MKLRKLRMGQAGLHTEQELPGHALRLRHNQHPNVRVLGDPVRHIVHRQNSRLAMLRRHVHNRQIRLARLKHHARVLPARLPALHHVNHIQHVRENPGPQKPLRELLKRRKLPTIPGLEILNPVLPQPVHRQLEIRVMPPVQLIRLHRPPGNFARRRHRLPGLNLLKNDPLRLRHRPGPLTRSPSHRIPPSTRSTHNSPQGRIKGPPAPAVKGHTGRSKNVHATASKHAPERARTSPAPPRCGQQPSQQQRDPPRVALASSKQTAGNYVPHYINRPQKAEKQTKFIKTLPNWGSLPAFAPAAASSQQPPAQQLSQTQKGIYTH